MTGTTYANDSFVELPLRTETNPDRYHRATVDVCYGGQMSLTDAAGGGMNARLAWLAQGGPRWSETQDIVIYPGCNRMTFDLATDPAVAVNDENTVYKSGWRGQRFEQMRFDLNEDRGYRNFALREIKLADDAAFSTSYPITFHDNAGTGGTTADIYVSTTQGDFQGTRIAHGLAVAGGVNTFTWNGNNEAGQQMPNATYWVYIVMRNGSGVGTATASGPLRLERPVPLTPSYFVPLTPARLLDTRTGEGGNITPLGQQVFTELDVTGVGGVPETGVTAVVMNVTVDGPTDAGFLTAWPSGEARPTVSNLNFVPGQTVPNLVTVKVGANGRVNLFNSTGATSVVADVVGYYTSQAPSSGGRFTPLTPSRVLDTRDGTGRGGAVGPVGAGQSIDVDVTGLAGVPAIGRQRRGAERHRRPTHQRRLHHHLADGGAAAERVDPQLHPGAHRRQPRAGQGGERRQGVDVQLRWFDPPRRRRDRLLLGDRRRIRAGHPGTARRHPRGPRWRARPARAGRHGVGQRWPTAHRSRRRPRQWW